MSVAGVGALWVSVHPVPEDLEIQPSTGEDVVIGCPVAPRLGVEQCLLNFGGRGPSGARGGGNGELKAADDMNGCWSLLGAA